MLKKAYLEITSECNLACSFCHGTSRKVKYMTEAEFTEAAKKLRPHTEYLYFHLMGEPLLHPLLKRFFEIAAELGFKVVITTNGTLLEEKKEILLSAPSLHKVSISLHAYEANAMDGSPDKYLDECFSFCDEASARGIICVMRLWNLGGEDSMNGMILRRMEARFPKPWQDCQNGFKLRNKLFLEYGERFEWPDEEAELYPDNHSCYGLRDQVGVLSDGRIVPCCLDADGVITLGNIFESELSEVLNSPRAVALKRSFETRCIKEPLCLRCGFAATRVK